MTIETPDDVTAAVPQEMHRTPEARRRVLIGKFVKSGEGYRLQFTFQLERGEATLPKAPITRKVAA